jgi:hypothetical protein
MARVQKFPTYGNLMGYVHISEGSDDTGKYTCIYGEQEYLVKYLFAQSHTIVL